MGSRIFVVPIDTVTVGAAVQDIFALLAPAAKGFQLHHIQLTAAGIAVPTYMRLRLKHATATVTLGSGGTVITPAPVDPGDTLASTVTAHANDTTQATTSGAFTMKEPFQWNTLLPFDYMPGPEDPDRETALAAQALILDTPAALGQAFTVSGFIKFREMP